MNLTMSSFSSVISLIYALIAVTCLILSCWATQGRALGSNHVSHSETNECLNDSIIGGNCLSGQDQVEDDSSNESTNLNFDSPVGTYDDPEYTNDCLSKEDQDFYKSKNSTYWRAKNQETLKQVLILHRHGDRTPISFAPRDSLVNEPFWQFHGLGQLTNRGKARLHMLGQIIRQRYNVFLNGSVNKNMRKSRASGSLRCIESAQVFLSSFLSLNSTNSPDASSLVWDKQPDQLAQLWQPASILTLPAKYDAMLNEGASCENLNSEFQAFDNSTVNKELLIKYRNVVEVMKNEIDFDIDHFYKWFWASSQLEVERSYFEDKLSSKLLDIYDELVGAGEQTLELYQSSLKSRRMRSGLLINDIINNMKDIREPNRSQFSKKFVHYSAHDITVFFLLGLLENVKKYPHRPDYASSLIFELHQDQSEWFVKLYYFARVPSEPLELHIDSCEKGHSKRRCTLDKFSQLMQKYCIASWTAWMQECGNSMNGFNPYDENY